MRTSTDRILTSHAGSLPRPDHLIEANRAREAGKTTGEDEFQQKLRAAVAGNIDTTSGVAVKMMLIRSSWATPFCSSMASTSASVRSVICYGVSASIVVAPRSALTAGVGDISLAC